ncbi:hypothetical protein C9F11_42990 (plasmid) [Streptomyces sp. YIM 121038]|uniref:hypothetical protein n=1 Tax=Streptomyces sp. YIM 121038 TaxID=2136401 RepID=UPI00110FFB07|nr:hypothetical protein [Streptomyces sp. YIM 121038]QCX82178.1 hypothetical protein C9F11_42990 [Streptomyces sp. YIM 121038]
MSASHSPSNWKVFALFGAAVLLAVTGTLLLVLDPGRTAPRTDPPASSAEQPKPAAPQDVRPPAPTPPAQSPAAAEPEPATPDRVPPKAAETARRFVIVWGSHDARRDSSFSAAGRRAAVYATDELARQLSDPGQRSARLWQQWVTDQTRVTCAVDRVAIPDGAPPPTVTRAYVRVLFTCTSRTADQQPTRSHDQLALEMHRLPAGMWRVGALIDA